MVVERQHVTENGSPGSAEQPFHKVSTKRVRAVPSQNIYRPPAARRLEALVSTEYSANTAAPVETKQEKVRVAKQRRPDIQVYVPRAKRNSALIDQDVPPQRTQSPVDLPVSNGAVSKSPGLHSRWGSGTIVSDSPVPRVRRLVRHSTSEQNVSASECKFSDLNSPETSVSSVNGQKNDDTLSELELSCHMECPPQAVLSCDNNVPLDESRMELGNCDRVEVSVKEEKVIKESHDEHSSTEKSDSGSEVLNLDIVCSADVAHERKKDDDDETYRKREEQNRKNRRILRGNYMSDVLIISDHSTPEPSSSAPPSVEDLSKNSPIIIAKKKKKVIHKTESLPAVASSSGSSGPCLNPDECTWDMMFDDNGECLDPKLMEELTNAVGSVNITKPQSNYNQYQTKSELMLPAIGDEFAHVIEIYDFPAEFKTQDLLSVFSPYKNAGFEIKWVDDTHALGVFSSSVVAADVLATDHPFVKTRPLRDATPESRSKARRSAEFLQPYRARPETCVALARRLVTASLGVRLNTSREEREAERKVLREAREKRRLVARQRDDAWEGNFGDK